MVQCLRKYEWVKLPRSRLPEGRGIMGAWARLASHAAFRKGQALYCGYSNEVMPGMWSGGIVGLKKILGIKNRQTALDIMNRLSEYGYLSYTLEAKTKKFTYRILDWVVRCSGRACTEGSVYAVDGYGFLCLPRNLTERLVERGHIFEEADAWLDLWCHTVARDPRNAFSCLAPAIQYRGASITLETLGTRWGWEKTKVWRFFKKHGDVFSLHRLPGNYGCVLFNILYPIGTAGVSPTQKQVEAVWAEWLRLSKPSKLKSKTGTQRNFHRTVDRYSRRIMKQTEHARPKCGVKNRVALSVPIIRAYLSLCRNCKNCSYDCRRMIYSRAMAAQTIRGLCRCPGEVRYNVKIKEKGAKNMKQEKTSKPHVDNEISAEAVIRYLTKRGILEEKKISTEKLQDAKAQRMSDAYHNTLLLLKHYRMLSWLMECFPDTIAEELDQPYEALDKLIDRLDMELAMGNRKLENRLAGIEKSRLILDRVNEALTVLKKKPEDGQRLYDLIYLTYIAPEKLNHQELLYRLNLSSRHYYRCRDQAVHILSLRLWSSPSKTLDIWLEIAELLREMD